MKNINEICVLDWGMGHIDNPIIDIANLFHNLEFLKETEYQNLFDLYFSLTKRDIYQKLDPSTLIKVGLIMHLIYFINFQLHVVETEIVDHNRYTESIHRKLTKIIEIVES